jgi:hypothetical protein
VQVWHFRDRSRVYIVPRKISILDDSCGSPESSPLTGSLRFIRPPAGRDSAELQTVCPHASEQIWHAIGTIFGIDELEIPGLEISADEISESVVHRLNRLGWHARFGFRASGHWRI